MRGISERSIQTKRKVGSCADTILKGWNETNFGSPIIYEKSEPNKVELVLPIVTQVNCGSNGGSNGGSNDGSTKGKDGLKKRLL